MLTWTALLLAAGMLAVGVRWSLTRVDALGRARPFPTVAVAVLAFAAMGAATPGLLRARLEHRLSAVAGQLVGAPVSVHCQTFGQSFVDAGAELGFVRYGPDGVPERSTLIKREPCHALEAYLRSDHEHPTADQVVAVHVLAHESMHMAGLTAESAAECAAVQRDAEAARGLGADPAQAVALARRYWTEVYPRLPEAYVSAQCRAGGPLDERLADAPWSTAPATGPVGGPG